MRKRALFVIFAVVLPLSAASQTQSPHTHATDVVLVPVTAGVIELVIGDRTVTAVQPGEVQFVNRNVVHSLKNSGTQPFELIAIAVK
ncbi:MAG TPA: cupin domain-containing protein [Vicinamibacterales bacterium]|jgi:quercetin dioxygenase-like cupin family protein|nr:cupin domain-containing protein [Vicinamibacterales bacterium]